MISDKSQQHYKLNRNVDVTVKSKREADGIVRNELIMKFTNVDREPLEFADADDISKFITGIDFEDDQLPLPGTEKA